MTETYNLYINRCKAYIAFMLSQQQWSGLTKATVEEWIENFRDLSEEEKCLVYRLLTSIIYFSENDVIEALKEGIHHCLYYESILKKQITSDFSLSAKALANIESEELAKTCFIPLLDSDAPHESGNYVTRTLVQQGIIKSTQSVFLDKLPDLLKRGAFSRLVIVDDCVGSGDQLDTFWTEARVNVDGSSKRLRDLCNEYGVDANYLTLFGYINSIENLKTRFTDLKIWCVRCLSDTQRVFMDDSYVWKNQDELNKAKALFESITQAVGIPLYGYKGLDFAFIMHRTIPDWSLPLFWMEKPDWRLLMRRKNSSV